MANAALEALVKATATYATAQAKLDAALVEQAATAQKVIDLQTLVANLQSEANAAKQAVKAIVQSA